MSGPEAENGQAADESRDKAVAAALAETYRPEGVAIWWAAYDRADKRRRHRMLASLHHVTDGRYAVFGGSAR